MTVESEMGRYVSGSMCPRHDSLGREQSVQSRILREFFGRHDVMRDTVKRLFDSPARVVKNVQHLVAVDQRPVRGHDNAIGLTPGKAQPIANQLARQVVQSFSRLIFCADSSE